MEWLQKGELLEALESEADAREKRRQKRPGKSDHGAIGTTATSLRARGSIRNVID
jgi:hypothetical protein